MNRDFRIDIFLGRRNINKTHEWSEMLAKLGSSVSKHDDLYYLANKDG